MHRNERNTIGRLFKAAHGSRESRQLSSAWRNSVMGEVSRYGSSTPMSDMERLAPRFALAAIVIFITVLTAGAPTLVALPGEFQTAYTTQAFTVTNTLWGSL